MTDQIQAAHTELANLANTMRRLRQAYDATLPAYEAASRARAQAEAELGTAKAQYIAAARAVMDTINPPDLMCQ